MTVISRLTAAALAALALAAVVIPAPASASSHKGLAVWAENRDIAPAVPLAELAELRSYFDLVQPAEHAPGRWDACYRVLLRQFRPKYTASGTSTVSVWASTHGRTPPGRVVGHPVFSGTEWVAWWVPSSGHVTFALEYTGTTAAVIPFRRWTYGTVHLQEMLKWMIRRGYLTGREELAGVSFGWEFAPGSGGSFTLRRYFMWERSSA
jgi:hypothetical protein